MTGDEAKLHRALGGVGITVYAIGDILGAGIYALVGAVVGAAGGQAWISFLVAGAIAALTGLTYAELVARFPVSAGAAAYCRRAFRPPVIAFLAGFFVLASGIISAAAVSRAVVGYLDTIVVLPDLAVSIGLLSLMTIVSYRGIRESANVNFALTAVELSGLLLVVGAGVALILGGSSTPATDATPGAIASAGPLDGILAGVTLAFFAYIGFEDTVNVSEEVKDASRVVPRAILVAIGVTTLVYLAVVAVALATVPATELASSDAPLLAVLTAADVSVPSEAFAIVALLAIANTGLLNLIMASRLAYGMAHERLLPRVLARVHPKRRTPAVAVFTVFALAIALAVSGGVEVLAQTTSLLLLIVFGTVHVALIVVKRRDRTAHDGFRTARFTPWLGAAVCAAMITRYPLEVYLRAGAVLAVGLVVYVAIGRGHAGRTPS